MRLLSCREGRSLGAPRLSAKPIRPGRPVFCRSLDGRAQPAVNGGSDALRLGQAAADGQPQQPGAVSPAAAQGPTAGAGAAGSAAAAAAAAAQSAAAASTSLKWNPLYFDSQDDAAARLQQISDQLKGALRLERYNEAAALRSEAAAIEDANAAAALQATLREALQDEQYETAAALRDEGSMWVEGWWYGHAGDDDVTGHLLRVSCEYGRWTGRVYSCRDLFAALDWMPKAPGSDWLVMAWQGASGFGTATRARPSLDYDEQEDPASFEPLILDEKALKGTGAALFEVFLRRRGSDGEGSSGSSSGGGSSSSSGGSSSRGGFESQTVCLWPGPLPLPAGATVDEFGLTEAVGASSVIHGANGRRLLKTLGLGEGPLDELWAYADRTGELVRDAYADKPKGSAEVALARLASSTERRQRGGGGDTAASEAKGEEGEQQEQQKGAAAAGDGAGDQLEMAADVIVDITGEDVSVRILAEEEQVAAANEQQQQQQQQQGDQAAAAGSVGAAEESSVPGSEQQRVSGGGSSSGGLRLSQFKKWELNEVEATLRALRGGSGDSGESELFVEDTRSEEERMASANAELQANAEARLREEAAAEDAASEAAESALPADVPTASEEAPEQQPQQQQQEEEQQQQEEEELEDLSFDYGFWWDSVQRRPAEVARAGTRDGFLLLPRFPAPEEAAVAEAALRAASEAPRPTDPSEEEAVRSQGAEDMRMAWAAAQAEAQRRRTVDRIHTTTYDLGCMVQNHARRAAGRGGVRGEASVLPLLFPAPYKLPPSPPGAFSYSRIPCAGVGPEAVEEAKQAHKHGPLSGGVFFGSFGTHGPEVVMLTHGVDEEDGAPCIIGTKLTGDENVPAGQVSFTAKIGRKHRRKGTDEYPADMGVVASYPGRGRVAERGFTNAKWVEGELLEFAEGASPECLAGARLGFVWAVPGERRFMILLNRIHLC